MKNESNKIFEKFGTKLLLNENLSKYSWFNLGGPAKIFFKPDTLEQLKSFLLETKNNFQITCLGAGSNTLIRDGGVDGIVIKLSPKFSYTNLESEEMIEVGAATLDRTLSNFASENSLGGFEFLSCIPGTIGGAIIMNSGCYGDEISNILHSVKTINFEGFEQEFQRDEIKLFYRGTNLPKNMIITSAKFKGIKKSKKDILNKIKGYLEKKKNSQPSKIKTCGSTFKNPNNKKAWKLIKESGCQNISFGQASISEKHCNFFVNDGGATSKDIEKLIEHVKNKVFQTHDIKLDLEIKLIGKP